MGEVLLNPEAPDNLVALVAITKIPAVGRWRPKNRGSILLDLGRLTLDDRCAPLLLLMLDRRGAQLDGASAHPGGQLDGVGLALGRGHPGDLMRYRAADIDLAAIAPLLRLRSRFPLLG
jgi:hypothetical protein